jgi:predicted ATPase
LVRVGKKSFALKIGFDSHKVDLTYPKRSRLKINAFPELDVKISIKLCAPRTVNIREKNGKVLLEVGKKIWKDNGFVFLFVDILLDIFRRKIAKMVPMSCFYLPAARSGILQGHKALAASIVKKAPYVGIEKFEIPKFSGVVSDFISSVITLPEKKGPFYSLAQEFEKDLIRGEIVVRALDEYVPEIKYVFQKTEIPLHRASSTVSELAPLFLYLKYTIEPGSILIIEEPEAHLHPGNQRILAKFLVKLVRRGVNIIATTHSEYLLSQLSSFIMLSKVKPQKRVKKYKYTEEDFLQAEEVAAYVFDYDKTSGGHKIREIEITGEDGISQEEFLKIHEALYEETLKLRRDLRSKT